MFPCSSEINGHVPLFLQILLSYSPCSLILPLFPSKVGLSSSVPLKKCHFSLFAKTPADVSYATD